MPTPTPIFKGAEALQEQPGSPEWRFGESIELVRTLRGKYLTALASAPGRGALGTGAAAGLRVLESTVVHERGGLATLTIRFGTIPGVPYNNLPVPRTEESVERGLLNFAVDSHPMFAALDKRTRQNIKTYTETAPTSGANEEAFEELAALPPATKAVMENLLSKLQRNITVYSQWPPVFRRISYSWEDPSPLSGGGFIQEPIPQIITIPSGFQWLREADDLHHDGTFYRLAQKWTGGKNIEADLYTP